jgi:hypothetical protein
MGASPRIIILAMVVVLFLAMGAVVALSADVCPNLMTQVGIKLRSRRSTATLTVKITNAGTTDVDEAGLALELPVGVAYESVKVKPKPCSYLNLVEKGSAVTWTGVSIDSHKTCTFRVTLAFYKVTGKVSLSTFTGALSSPLTCATTTTMTITVRAFDSQMKNRRAPVGGPNEHNHTPHFSCVDLSCPTNQSMYIRMPRPLRHQQGGARKAAMEPLLTPRSSVISS